MKRLRKIGLASLVALALTTSACSIDVEEKVESVVTVTNEEAYENKTVENTGDLFIMFNKASYTIREDGIYIRFAYYVENYYGEDITLTSSSRGEIEGEDSYLVVQGEVKNLENSHFGAYYKVADKDYIKQSLVDGSSISFTLVVYDENKDILDTIEIEHPFNRIKD